MATINLTGTARTGSGKGPARQLRMEAEARLR